MNRIAATTILSLLLALHGTVCAQAQVRKIAVLSRIGDVLTVDVYRQRTGTTIDSNARETVALATPTLDHAALFAAQDALARLYPNVPVTLLGVPAAGSENDPARLLADGNFRQPGGLLSALKRESYTHLVVVSKHRAPARFQLGGRSVGSGYLTGLGFYVDQALRTSRSDTGEVGRGFLAPYAYLKLTVIDVESPDLVREKEVLESSVSSAARNEQGLGPWEALTAAQKLATLQELTAEGVAAAIPGAFGATK